MYTSKAENAEEKSKPRVLKENDLFSCDHIYFPKSKCSASKHTSNASKLIEKCFLDLRNIFLNQENIRKFFSKQEDLSS